ncbi:hypothetical protein EYF80_005094 [Liparis tanakae]|uniref:Uncharacterized protein n=1 Tax=Liparis tanakae TaxID=230148 RepID=A0A4Z2J381_9TELE|nr:hypothetical protein EYF80_005094 [Liparis tanakae]
MGCGREFPSGERSWDSSRTHLLSTPPSREALRHSGGERRLCTSATVTLYFDVELRRDRRPGTEQNTSLGFTTPPKRPSLFRGMALMLLFLDKDTGPIARERGRVLVGQAAVLVQQAALLTLPLTRPSRVLRLRLGVQ